MRLPGTLTLAPALTLCAAVCVCAGPADDAHAQNPSGISTRHDPREWGGREYRDQQRGPRDIFASEFFTFARIRYTSYGEDPQFNLRGRWTIDYPDSDVNFSWRLSQLTTVKVNTNEQGEYKYAIVRPTDPELFDYPFVYLIEPGELVFTEEEAAGLRQYLMRGGFLMVDDFWGTAEWLNWESQFARVLDPVEYPVVELPMTHPVFSCVFEIKEKPQVPNPWHWRQTGGGTSERGYDSQQAHYKGVHNKDGRLIAIFCHNTDLGDGWEREGISEDYFNEMSVKKAYPMGINIVVYALTH